ncbi:hypothetical protein H310_11965 [Aphanomyces invadans]|uniref:Uncharacterized protein n=1 Tax=Aphanomyces invadans TaxID=157072 RepID=A0A024TL30_9STRA|nr:hypothetical protein H310_11965 [Aphanomyces invadans]ETV94316.1 hypothetical protein H310_11965 [Aphanomyces invadans]|eukprot:XP_008877078.1 hypothetical protein H310_11965 [Aphanomyces invadans]
MAQNNVGKVLVGSFVGITAATIGYLHVYLPNFTELGQQVHDRAASTQASGASPVAGSMWKNLNRQAGKPASSSPEGSLSNE